MPAVEHLFREWLEAQPRKEWNFSIDSAEERAFNQRKALALRASPLMEFVNRHDLGLPAPDNELEVEALATQVWNNQVSALDRASTKSDYQRGARESFNSLFKLANARRYPIWLSNVRDPLIALLPEYHSITYNAINAVYDTLLQ